MNIYAKLLDEIRTIAQQDSFVSTVTNKGQVDIDLNKGDLFPIVDIFVTGASFPSASVVRMSVDLVCIDLRDHNNEISTDKFHDQDNEIDNLNETLMVLNRIWQKLYKNWEDNNITASDAPTLEPIMGDGKNIYDGWLMQFDVDLPNTVLSLC